LLIVAFLVAVPLHAQAPAKDASVSGNRFLDICSVVDKADRKERVTETDLDDVSFCTGFVLGVNDGANAGIDMLNQIKSLPGLKGMLEDVAICLPDDVTAGQEIRITLKYIREHPEQANLRSVQLVLLAEFYAFPCPVTAPTPTPKPKQ
jgi:Ssp1 endopeptidase immunity protein Rap1a